MKKSSNILRKHRKKRIRKKVNGTAKRPRICIFRSNRAIYVQLIDDEQDKVLTQADSRKVSKNPATMEAAEKTGKEIAKKLKELKITQAVFDRGGYKYHGKVKALAEAIRKEGIEF